MLHKAKRKVAIAPIGSFAAMFGIAVTQSSLKKRPIGVVWVVIGCGILFGCQPAAVRFNSGPESAFPGVPANASWPGPSDSAIPRVRLAPGRGWALDRIVYQGTEFACGPEGGFPMFTFMKETNQAVVSPGNQDLVAMFEGSDAEKRVLYDYYGTRVEVCYLVASTDTVTIAVTVNRRKG